MHSDARIVINHADRVHQSSVGTAWAYLKYWIWLGLTKLFLGPIYLVIISEGLRTLIPALGTKLHKLPFLASLHDFEATHRLDLAPFLAVFLLIAVWYLWPKIIVIWMTPECARQKTPEQQLVIWLGIGILGCDAVLFYYAMTQLSWGTSVLSFSALISTASYVGVLVAVSFISVKHNPRFRKAGE